MPGQRSACGQQHLSLSLACQPQLDSATLHQTAKRPVACHHLRLPFPSCLGEFKDWLPLNWGPCDRGWLVDGNRSCCKEDREGPFAEDPLAPACDASGFSLPVEARDCLRSQQQRLVIDDLKPADQCQLKTHSIHVRGFSQRLGCLRINKSLMDLEHAPKSSILNWN